MVSNYYNVTRIYIVVHRDLTLFSGKKCSLQRSMYVIEFVDAYVFVIYIQYIL